MSSLEPSSRGERPGRMTATLRALAPTGPRVLRVGMVLAGRIVEERIVRHRASVTIGSSAGATFALSDGLLPDCCPLFEAVGDTYVLCFRDGMTGRVALATGVATLEELRGRARRGAHGWYRIPLTEEARGRVVVGDVAFLFQFVVPAPAQPRPQLPVSVTRGTELVDWTTTLVAALSFLVHFMAVGAIYSDWLDPVIDDDLTVGAVVDTVQSLPTPPEVDATPELAPASPQSGAPTPTPRASETPRSSERSGDAGSAAGRAPVSAPGPLLAELDALELATLHALHGAGPATHDVLGRGELPTGALDEAAARATRVGTDGLDGLHFTTHSPMRPGSTVASLSELGRRGRSAGTEGPGTAQRVVVPRGRIEPIAAPPTPGLPDAERVIGALQAGFRACYQRALEHNPDAQGTVRLVLTVGPNGEVQSASASATGDLGSAVGCIQARAQLAHFQPPAGGRAVLVVPVRCVRQR